MYPVYHRGKKSVVDFVVKVVETNIIEVAKADVL